MIAKVLLVDDGLAPVAVPAQYFARRNLSLEHAERTLMSGRLHDAGGLRARVMEVQDNRV